MVPSSLSPAAGEHPITLRAISPADVPEAGRIVYAAFAGINEQHGFPLDFRSPESAIGLVDAYVSHPSIWGVVAERGGRVVGSNFLDERGTVRGVGPITVDPATQAGGAGRRLMEAVLERAEGADGVRLLQDGFNMRSMALYASLGFELTDPVVVMAGRPRGEMPEGHAVRPLTEDDLSAAAELSLLVHGYERTAELADALAAGGANLVEADGRVVGYATSLAQFARAHAVAETAQAMSALVLAHGADTSFLLPTRQHELFRWALAAGLRVVKPMNYMVTGLYREPAGAWIPSVLY